MSMYHFCLQGEGQPAHFSQVEYCSKRVNSSRTLWHRHLHTLALKFTKSPSSPLKTHDLTYLSSSIFKFSLEYQGSQPEMAALAMKTRVKGLQGVTRMACSPSLWLMANWLVKQNQPVSKIETKSDTNLRSLYES